MRSVRLALLAFTFLLIGAAPASAIVGGTEATRDWPHMAAMEFRDGPGDATYAFRCGGSLVAPDVVLTAAHCVDADAERDDGGATGTYPATNFQFLLGSKDRRSGGERIPAVEVLEHPNYDATVQRDDDVALVKLARPTTLGRTIRLAEDADAAQWAPGKRSTVIGWGVKELLVSYDASQFGDTSPTLRQVDVTVRSDQECGLSNGATVGFDAGSYLCAGEPQGGKDSCQGDSGGPLMVPDASGAFIQIGVVSYGFECGYPSQYGVYTEVGSASLRGWVKDNTARMTGTGTAPPPPADPAPAATTTTTAPALPTTRGARRATLRLPSALGSIRRARRRKGFFVGLRFDVPVTISARLEQRGRTVARGTRRNLRTGRIRLGLVRGRRVRPGKARLSVVVRDADGRRTTAARTVRITR